MRGQKNKQESIKGQQMRGFFGIGVEGISKQMNAGSIFRSAHAFGASFVFTVNAQYSRQLGNQADTSDFTSHVPFYAFPDIDTMLLPRGCDLVGVELTDDAIDLPSFHHPTRCAYILGPERGSLSQEMIDRCRFTIKIPTSFCVNVGVAAAITMYDRVQSIGKFAPRPVAAGGPTETLPKHVSGGPIIRTEMKKFETDPPAYSEAKPVRNS